MTRLILAALVLGGAALIQQPAAAIQVGTTESGHPIMAVELTADDDLSALPPALRDLVKQTIERTGFDVSQLEQWRKEADARKEKNPTSWVLSRMAIGWATALLQSEGHLSCGDGLNGVQQGIDLGIALGVLRPDIARAFYERSMKERTNPNAPTVPDGEVPAAIATFEGLWNQMDEDANG